MADSNITKRALAASLKGLMVDTPFAKITISDICDACGMSRKSFYYHFKDKYDLVNWIFESEYIIPTRIKYAKHFNTAEVESLASDERWDLAKDLCNYFYHNRSFYSKVLQIKGQNCFTDYFRDILRPLLAAQFSVISPEQTIIDFCTELYMDAAICALERWIVQKNAMPPEEFTQLLMACIKILPDLTALAPHE